MSDSTSWSWRPVPIEATTSDMPTSPTSLHPIRLMLVPLFRETEVDSYFGAFKRHDSAWRWPRAQEAVAALSLEDSLNYEAVKVAVLRTYKLVPEAYRQKFRNHRKARSQTHVDFARGKALFFDKWSSACNATDFITLRELVLQEN